MPRFYLRELIRQLSARRFRWHHPFSGKEMELTLTADQKAVVVLWSKDFSLFLSHRQAFETWPLFFHFTINTPDPLLEPDLPSLDDRLHQLSRLVDLHGTKAVRWRFDPIVWYHVAGNARSNLPGFPAIARRVESLGIHDVTISFMDSYRKISRRVRRQGERVTFAFPSDVDLIERFLEPAEQLSDMGFTIHTCCEPVLAASGLPGVSAGRCIDAYLLSEISGFELSPTPDHGQRRSAGCGCHKSTDIGCYTHHRCCGQCLYCYARP